MEKTLPRQRLVVIGAGPAGLTAALEACCRGFAVTVLEETEQVGGLAKTIVREGNNFDIGPHRFFTKYQQVEQWWREVLQENFITVRRLTRIYYHGKFFDYPLRPVNALLGLGIIESFRLGGSYLWARVHPRRPEITFEDWVSNRFGRRLFSLFFRSYTEKVWGIPCSDLSADWAAQRIKLLSLSKAVTNALWPQRKKITTLIDQFQYPRRGSGMLWERARQLVEQAGGRIFFNHPVVEIRIADNGAFTVRTQTAEGSQTFSADAVISSMPLPDLVSGLRPQAPAAVRQIAATLTYRDLILVGIVVNRINLFPDNWIYIHDPRVRVSRVQNYNNWGADMVADPAATSLGVEYHCQQNDDIWSRTDAQLIRLAVEELRLLGLVRTQDVTRGWVMRVPRAYPRYTGNYRHNVETIARYLSSIPNFYTVGRNGMHRYNNQDHSMLTAMLAVENLCGGDHDLWSVNVDDEYHETKIMPSLHSTSSR